MRRVVKAWAMKSDVTGSIHVIDGVFAITTKRPFSKGDAKDFEATFGKSSICRVEIRELPARKAKGKRK